MIVKHSAEGDGTGNSRNGYNKKTLQSQFGETVIKVPRDRNVEFEPQVIGKYQTKTVCTAKSCFNTRSWTNIRACATEKSFAEHSAYASSLFLLHTVKAAPFKVHAVQTDNGHEFTHTLFGQKVDSPTRFKLTLKLEETPIPVVECESACKLAKYRAAIVAPVVTEGDVSGCVVFITTEGMPSPGETDYMLAQTIAGFLSRQRILTSASLNIDDMEEDRSLSKRKVSGLFRKIRNKPANRF